MSLSFDSSKLAASVTSRCIYKCLKTSARFGGCLFGPYLFDVVLPYYTGTDPVSNSTVDIWFTSSADVTRFVQSMDHSFQLISDSPNNHHSQYHLLKYSIPVALINVVVSDNFPSTDSNTVPIGAFTDLAGVFRFQSFSDTSFPDLVKSLLKR
jgi:hypothetical protein